MHRSYTILGILFAWIATAPSNSSADGIEDQTVPDKPYHLEVDKSERLLKVKYGGHTYLQFQVAHGRGGTGDKQRRDDRLTPEGIYRVAGFNDSSEFHFFIRLNYPNAEDAFTGLRNNIISEYEFNQIIKSLRRGKLPPQNTALGGAIGIHGVGVETPEKLHIHTHLNWTKGCIALTNDEISALRQYVTIGTEVVIKE